MANKVTRGWICNINKALEANVWVHRERQSQRSNFQMPPRAATEARNKPITNT